MSVAIPLARTRRKLLVFAVLTGVAAVAGLPGWTVAALALTCLAIPLAVAVAGGTGLARELLRPRRRPRAARWPGSQPGTRGTICYLSWTRSTQRDSRCSMATLPVLPLTDAVLLPGMVIPVTLDPTTQAAVDAARATGDQQLLAVPRLDGEYGPVGVVATIEKVGRLPSGEPAAVVRGLSRGPDRLRRARPRRRPLGRGDADSTSPRPPASARELAREYKALVIAVLQQRGAWQVIDAVERMTDPSELADSAGYAPWLDPGRRRPSCSARADVTARLELLVGWVRDHLAELEVAEQISDDVREGMEKTPAGVPAAPAARRDPQGTRRGRAGRRRRLPRPGRERRPARQGPRGGAARGRQAGAGQRRLPGGRLDPDLARHGAGDAVEHAVPRTTPTSPRPARCSTPTTPAWPT